MATFHLGTLILQRVGHKSTLRNEPKEEKDHPPIEVVGVKVFGVLIAGFFDFCFL